MMCQAKSFIHRKNQAHKVLGTTERKLCGCFGQLYFSLRKLSIARHGSFWQVKLRKERIRMYIFRASRKLPDGTKIYARDYGKRCFPIWIGPGPEPEATRHVYY